MHLLSRYLLPVELSALLEPILTKGAYSHAGYAPGHSPDIYMALLELVFLALEAALSTALVGPPFQLLLYGATS